METARGPKKKIKTIRIVFIYLRSVTKLTNGEHFPFVKIVYDSKEWARFTGRILNHKVN